MRKDLIFRYLNSCYSNLSRIGIHLLDQENDDNLVNNPENDRITKELYPEITELDFNFIESQLENISKTAQFLKTEIKNLKK